ncbi:MAG: hypothetical protein SCH39_11985 [Methanosarcinales archaeon]|nr:hypothetical protein [ANME-2 cluster archaeon]MDW7777033.1 hypothetical protein [Methanosarcinales archaeon]
MKKKSLDNLAIVLALAGVSFVLDYSVNKMPYQILGGNNFGDIGVYLAVIAIVVAVVNVLMDNK